MRKNIWRLSLVLAAVFCVGGFLTVHAFNGPNCAPPGNCSLLNADSNRNIGFGTTNATPSNGTFGYVFSIASSTQPGFSLNNTGGGHNYVWYSTNAGTLNLWDVTANSSRLSVDTIGNLNVVNNVSGGSLSGTMSTSTSAVSSGNIVSNAGEYFGKFTGGGNYAFPANLGVGTSSNLGLPSVLFVNGTSTFMNGSVGIGTTAPSAPLEIFKSVTG